MKRIGIILAMQEEFEEIRNIMEKTDEIMIQGITFVKGSIENQECVFAQSGVGKVNAARVTQMMIDNFEIKFMINLGAAGALNPMLEIGDIVIGEEVVQHDFDITAFGHAKGFITGVGDRVYCDNNLIERFKNAMENLNSKTYKIKTGIIATGDIFCTDSDMKNKIYANFKADCVEMEGAAIAQVCYLDNIPFIVIRSISDTPNGNNAITFDEFVELASKRCAKILKEVLKDIKEEKIIQEELKG